MTTPSATSASCISSTLRALRPGLVADAGDRVGVELAEVVGAVRIGVAPVLHRLRPALLDRRVVEEGVGRALSASAASGEGAGRSRAIDLDRARLDAAQHASQPVGVHRVVEAVAHRLRDQRVVGHLAVAGEVLGAGDLVREDRREQVLRAHALQLRRDLLAAAKRGSASAVVAFQRQRTREQRRVEQRLHEHVERGRRVQVARDLVEREAVAGREREDDRVLGRRGLELEVEAAAEALPQRQAPGAVEAAAERRVDDELHAAGASKKRSMTMRCCVGSAPRAASGAGEVVDDLARRLVVEADRRERSAAIAPRAPSRAMPRADLLAQPRHRERQLVAAPRRLAEPERDARRRAVRVLDADAAGLDAQDALAGVAELEDVAGDALDREVLVDGADVGALRLEDDGVVAGLGDRAARGQRGQARALRSRRTWCTASRWT